MILIGSRALNHYISLQRKIHDWDFLIDPMFFNSFHDKYKQYHVKTIKNSYLYDIESEIVEAKNMESLDPTDLMILNDGNFVGIETKFGHAWIPSIQTLYDIKKATALCIDEPKHHHDVKLIEQNHSNLIQESDFFKMRLAETRARSRNEDKTLYEFFHKYHIPEYVKHDRLHEMIADLLGLPIPTYVRTTDGTVSTSETLFNRLTHDQKVSLAAEESIVLSLERWFIPQMVENGINHTLVDKWYNNNEAMPPYRILKHVCITGLKGEAVYVVNSSRELFFEVEKKWAEYRQAIRKKGGFPQSFYTELFDLRKRYRNKEKVAVV